MATFRVQDGYPGRLARAPISHFVQEGWYRLWDTPMLAKDRKWRDGAPRGQMGPIHA